MFCITHPHECSLAYTVMFGVFPRSMTDSQAHDPAARPTRMRLFFGLPIPARVAQALTRHARTIHLANARWTPAENLHITLVFLGLVNEDKLPALFRELEGLGPLPLQLRLTSLGSFPRAGVLFAEVEPTPKLLELQATVAARMAGSGFALDHRPYHPHTTLARLRQPIRLSGDRLSLPFALQRGFQVDAVKLYRSHTEQEGARYEVLAQTKVDRMPPL